MSGRSLAVLAAAFLVLVSGAAFALEGLSGGASGVVREVVDGDTVVLEDGTTVRLVGIQTPKLPLGRAGFPTQPLAHETKAALEALVLGRRVTLSYGGQRIDRYGRALAHLEDEDGIWIQGELLRRGLARVYTFNDNRALSETMLAAEREARDAARGIWALDYYTVRGIGETEDLIGSYQIVEGRIVAADTVRGRAYLNFGPDYRTDFTISISPKDMRMFKRSNFDPTALDGRRVRVRGWLKSFNGPMIDVTHPEQIEVLEE